MRIVRSACRLRDRVNDMREAGHLPKVVRAAALLERNAEQPVFVDFNPEVVRVGVVPVQLQEVALSCSVSNARHRRAVDPDLRDRLVGEVVVEDEELGVDHAEVHGSIKGRLAGDKHHPLLEEFAAGNETHQADGHHPHLHEGADARKALYGAHQLNVVALHRDFVRCFVCIHRALWGHRVAGRDAA